MKALAKLSVTTLTLIICSSCLTRQAKTDTETLQETNATTAETEGIEDNSPGIIIGGDSIVLDNDAFAYYMRNASAIPDTEKAKYYTDAFMPAEAGEVFLLTSIPLYDVIKSHIIAESSSAWLVNYTQNGDYIDSRLIYSINGREHTYSKIYIPEKRLTVIDNDTYMDYGEVPVAVKKNGVFEGYPDQPFNKDTIAVMNCNGNGITGKLGLGQRWTALIFGPDISGVIPVMTGYHGHDYIDNLCTIFKHAGDDMYRSDIAVKGEYSENDLEILPLTTLEMDEATRKKINTDLHAMFLDNTRFDNTETMNEVFSFTHNDKEYRLAYYQSENDYRKALLDISSINNTTVLSYKCSDRFCFFRLGEKVFLYTNEDSCGEGATSVFRIYKVEDELRLIFEDDRSCD